MKKILKSLLIILLLSIFISPAQAQETAVEVNLSLSQDTVTVGESLQLAISVKHAGGNSLNLRDLSLPGIENFTQNGSSQSTQIQMVNGATAAITETVLNLTAKHVGEFKLGPIKIAQNGNIVAESEQVSITVTEAKKASFFSDEKANDVPKTKTAKKSGDFLTNILLVLFLIGLIVIFIRRKHSNVSEQTATEVIETEAPKTISGKLEIPDKATDDFYKTLKLNVTKYLEHKYTLELEPLTTKEMLAELKKKNIGQFNIVEQILTLCDQAQFMGTKDNAEKLLELAQALK